MGSIRTPLHMHIIYVDHSQLIFISLSSLLMTLSLSPELCSSFLFCCCDSIVEKMGLFQLIAYTANH